MAENAEIKAKEVVTKTLDSLAKSPSINLSDASADKIKGAVVKEMTSVIVNQTNQEPFYQSRVIIGSIVTLIGGSYTLVLDFMDGTPPTVDSLTAQVSIIGGALLVLYGRLIAKKPLGE